MVEEQERQLSWIECQDELRILAEKQLFFVGGAPRSGTTWLQQILDCHPQVSCRGEGHFGKQFAEPLQKLMADRRKALETKNVGLFLHTGGYPLPSTLDVNMLVGTAILLAFRQQCADKAFDAIGEKTPENIFFFPQLKRLFPSAKFIGIARDPRDVITSAWHFFYRAQAGTNETAAKIALIRGVMEQLNAGARIMIELKKQYPTDCLLFTYEALHHTPARVVAELFRFLGVSDAEEVVATSLERTSFAKQTGGRPAGVAKEGAFHRKGVVGDWPSTLTPEMNAMILQELGWMFPHFGWQR